MVVLAAIFMSWQEERSLTVRFERTRESLIRLFPGRRRVGSSYTGFTKALRSITPHVIEPLREQLRTMMHHLAEGRHMAFHGWVAFAVDGTKVECPRTAANLRSFGTAGKRGIAPQMLVTALWHLGTGLPWDWRIGKARASEHEHLRSMLSSLPSNAMIIGDGNFIGYELLWEIINSGRHFLVRPGGNAHLLSLGPVSSNKRETIVFLWPRKFRTKDKPLPVRLIRIKRGGKILFLMTSVFDSTKLSRDQARSLYAERWGIEVYFRSLKQTLGHRTMRSHAPTQARLEFEWTMIGAWVLGMMGVKARLQRQQHDLRRISFSGVLKIVRTGLRQQRTRGRQLPALLNRLADAEIDRYRRRSKKIRVKWPHQKTRKPPGPPKLKPVTKPQTQRIKELLIDQWPHLFTA